MTDIDDDLDYTSYGEFVDEMMELINEANKHFYQDLFEYYFKLLILPCNTIKARKSIMQVYKQYHELSKAEIDIFLLIKKKYGNVLEHLDHVDKIIFDLDRHYEFVYQYYERVLNTYEDLIDTHDPTRFILPKEEHDVEYYKKLQFKLLKN